MRFVAALRINHTNLTYWMNWITQPRILKGTILRKSIRLLSAICFLCATSLFADIQFDVFLGYDEHVPESSWFPVVCELKNDGPTFTGIVEVAPGAHNGGQPRRMIVELPTGSLKRITIPVFSSAQSYVSWDIRLLNSRGKVLKESAARRPKKIVGNGATLVGSMARTPSGLPTFRAITVQQSDLNPVAARLQPSLFPDNPLTLEGLDAIYLNSKRALELKENQVRALKAWLFAGGNLIVSVEQISDVNGTAWLRNLFPCELTGVKTVAPHPELQAWLRARKSGDDYPFDTLADDFNFENALLETATGKLLDGSVIVSSKETPMIVVAPRGRGRITAILFSTEREPARSWKNISTMWTKLAEVPSLLYNNKDFTRHGGWSADGIFGAMVDSKQVRKLPVHWLLLLLIVYLAVIGPIDQYWLKRIRKPMLTWITFPCYVALFSFMIYFIGYKLRSGETEWNELHVVDVIENGGKAELRGRTFASIYSPVNETYAVESKQPFATFRGEFSGSWQGGKETEKATVIQHGDNFSAELFVPVWTSQLFVSDWWQSAAQPLQVTLTPQGDGWKVKAESKVDRAISNAKIVIGEMIFDFGALAANETKTLSLVPKQGQPLQDFLNQHGGNFEGVVQSRQRSFGSTERGQIMDAPNAAISASFISKLSGQGAERFVSPPGLDLSPVIDRGQVVMFAWVNDFSPAQPINKFSARRAHRDTLLRIAVPLPQNPR